MHCLFLVQVRTKACRWVTLGSGQSTLTCRQEVKTKATTTTPSWTQQPRTYLECTVETVNSITMDTTKPGNSILDRFAFFSLN